MTKQRIAYAHREWYAAFARIQIRQKLTAGGVEFRVAWKHTNPDWVQLTFRADKKLQRRMVRVGDPLLIELRPQ